ncbi:MAG: RNA polymerase subunit sigma [Kurthia sp.]
MNHNNRDDEKLEDLLKHAPKLSDHRSKDDVLKRLQEDARLHNNPHLQQVSNDVAEQAPVKEKRADMTQHGTRQKKKIWLSALVSVASLFLVIVLVGPILSGNNESMSQEDRVMNKDMNKAKEEIESYTRDINPSSIEAESEAEAEATSEISNTQLMSLRSSVYEEDLVGATVFRLGMASSAAESIPVTFIVEQDKILADFATATPTSLQLYEKYAPQIDEQALGFQQYHPYKGTLREQGGNIVHVLPTGHQYDIASAAQSMYIGSLTDTFSNYNHVIFENEDGSIHAFSQEGKPSEPLSMSGMVNHYNYFLFTGDNGVEYLTSNFHQRFNSVIDAMNAMKMPNNDVYESVIPTDTPYTVREDKGVVVVAFEQPFDLETIDAKRATQMIEAFSLTAANFDQQVRFENIVQESWQGFDMRRSIPKPVGPNKNYLE